MMRLLRVAVLVLSPLGGGVVAVVLRQDNNWDLRNYHYYNAYAFLTNRFGFDIGPASIQTFVNPLLDLPFYLLIEHVRPVGVGFFLGAIQGLTVWLCFEIARGRWYETSSAPRDALAGFMFALVCAGLGLYAAGAASEIGTTFHDLTLTPLVLAALLLILRGASSPPSTPVFVGAGLLLGVAVGLKQTLGIYVPAMAAALLIGPRYSPWERFLVTARWAAGLAAGVILTGGYWMYFLYRRLETPFGAQFNSIFRSPYFPQSSGLDTRFFPDTALQTLFYPFFFHAREQTVMEGAFQDARFAVVYVMVVITLAVLVWRRRRNRRSDGGLSARDRMLLIFAVASYVVWQNLFSIYRYLIPLEVLCPVLIYVCLDIIVPRDRQTRLVICLGLFVFIAAAVRLPSWGRVPWSGSFFGTQVPPLLKTPDAIVVMVGLPTAFVIPAFPREIRFVRIDVIFAADRATRFRDTITSLLSSHSGEVYLLWHRHAPNPERYLVQYELNADLERCESVRNTVDPDVMLCPARRRGRAS